MTTFTNLNKIVLFFIFCVFFNTSYATNCQGQECKYENCAKTSGQCWYGGGYYQCNNGQSAGQCF